MDFFMTTAISSRVIQFLNESNRIEGIEEIDYRHQQFQDPKIGHFGAYLVSQQAARDLQPLTVKTIRCWQGMLGREQQRYTGTAIEDGEIGQIRGPALKKNVRVGRQIPPSYEDVPTLLQYLFEDLNEDLANNRELYERDDEAFAKFAASY